MPTTQQTIILKEISELKARIARQEVVLRDYEETLLADNSILETLSYLVEMEKRLRWEIVRISDLRDSASHHLHLLQVEEELLTASFLKSL